MFQAGPKISRITPKSDIVTRTAVSLISLVINLISIVFPSASRCLESIWFGDAVHIDMNDMHIDMHIALIGVRVCDIRS